MDYTFFLLTSALYVSLVKNGNFELTYTLLPANHKTAYQSKSNTVISFDAQCAGEQKKNKIASAYDSRLNLSKCTFLRCNDQCIDKCPMRIDLLVINWSLPFSLICHSRLSPKNINIFYLFQG